MTFEAISSAEMDERVLGGRMRDARVKAGYEMQQAAAALGMRRLALQRAEEGGKMPSLVKFREMVALYGASCEQLLFGQSHQRNGGPR